MLTTIVLIAGVVGLLYLFLTWNFDFWSKRGVAGPRPKPLSGNFPNSISQKLHMAFDLDAIYRRYKNEEDFVGIFSFRSPILMILSPTLCRRVFVNDFKHFHDNEVSTMVDKHSDFIFANNPFNLTGEEWKERRALLTPGLTPGRVKTVYPVTNKVCRKMSEFIKKQIKMAPKDGIDTKDLCLRFTTEVVTDCVLGLDAASFSDKPSPVMGMINQLFDIATTLTLYFIVVGFIPAVKKFWKFRFIKKNVEEFFMDLMENAIKLRKSEPAHSNRTDFLNYMLQLQEKKHYETRDLTANTMTFLLDGFETTACAISHCLLLLARYPATQERLRAEIISHVDSQGVMEFDKLADLPYLDACIHEAIRMFPPAVFSMKLCTEPIVLTSKSGSSVRLEKDDVVGLPLSCLMTDEDFYSNPHEFQPERFLEENNASLKKFRENGLYYGFGDGPRVCLGMRFALTQSKAALVEIIRNFHIRVNPKTRTDNTFDPKYFITRLEGGIFLEFDALN